MVQYCFNHRHNIIQCYKVIIYLWFQHSISLALNHKMFLMHTYEMNLETNKFFISMFLEKLF